MNPARSLFFLLALAYACRSGPESPVDDRHTALGSGDSIVHPEDLIIDLRQEQVTRAAIVWDTLQWTPVNREIMLSGIIEAPPQNLISVSIPMAGLLRSTHLLPGMQVSKGEVLAYMEDPAFIKMQEQYWSAKILSDKLNEELTLQQELLSNGSVNPKTLRDLRSNLRSAKVQAQSLGEQLRLLGVNLNDLHEHTLLRQIPVRSPVKGFVTKVHHSTGQYVDAGEVLYELVDPSDVHLRLNAYEKDLPFLYEKQEIKAYNNQAPDQEHRAHILLIGKEFAADRSVEVHCHFDRYDPGLIPGMYMRAHLMGKAQPAACLPSAALQNFRGQNYVFEKVNIVETGQNRAGANDSKLKVRGHKVKILQENTGITWFEFEKISTHEMKGRTFAIGGTYSLLMMAFNRTEEE
jgi:cobalt-zinc-cadmium efflux system membrane fusion protein